MYPIKVVESETQLTRQGGTVVLEVEKLSEEGFEDLQGPKAAELALNHAAKNGVAVPGISGPISVYPMDKSGKPVESPEYTEIVAWRADVPVASSIPG